MSDGPATTLVCPKCQSSLRTYERSGVTIEASYRAVPAMDSPVMRAVRNSRLCAQCGAALNTD